MSDPWKADLPVREDNIINESERSVDPADDEYKLVKLEDDGLFSEEFLPVFGTSPTVETTASGVHPSGATNATVVTMPTGIVAGDLLLLFFHHATSTTATASGFTKISTETTDRLHIFAKIATGGDTTTVTAGANNNTAYTIYRISGWNNVPDFSEVKLTINSGSNPPLLKPNGQYKNFLWIVGQAHTNTGTYTSAPTNYSNLVTPTSTGAGIGTAQRSLRDIYEQPGTFTTSGTISNTQTFTLSVRPAGK